METVQALEAARDQRHLTRTELAPGAPGPEGATATTTVLLLPEPALARLLHAPAAAAGLVNRGRKHPAKPLAHYFAGRTGPVCLTAAYHDPGQAERGVRALLAAPGLCPRGGRFLIGLDPALFQQLWDRAAVPATPPTPPPPPPSPTWPADTIRDEERQLQTLLDQHAAKLTVPQSLRDTYLGAAPVMDWVRRLIVLAARTEHPVLIQGDSGTGKEVVAHQIHECSARKNGSFVPVNCAGISAELLESELFGHVKGAFTGAVSDKKGLWAVAENGTLFLDEIGDLSPYHQAKILRALEGHYQPVGGTGELTARARVVAATNRDLTRMVADGRFRDDLYYRLFAIRIRTPALREHPGDIPELAAHFWRQLAGPGVKALSGEAMAALQAYSWFGNARELRAFLANVAALAEACPVTAEMIRAVMRDRLAPLAGTPRDQ